MIKRPICLVSLGLIFGILGGQYLEESICPLFFVYTVGLFGIVVLTFQRKEKRLLKIPKKIWILVLLATFIGFCFRKLDRKKEIYLGFRGTRSAVYRESGKARK